MSPKRPIELDAPPDVQESHRDLVRKYLRLSSEIHTFWHKFTPEQREEVIRHSIPYDSILEHRHDHSKGVVCKYFPEWNLKDLTSKPEHFLNILKSRGLTMLSHQLYEGANGEPGDRKVVEQSGMRYRGASEKEMTCFQEGEFFGRSFESTTAARTHLSALSFECSSLVIIPRNAGALILTRQQTIFVWLNSMIREIFHLGSETRHKKAPKKKVNDALTTAISNLRLPPKSIKSSLPEVRAQAVEAKSALENSLHLMRIEPCVLNNAVGSAFWSRAELVADDQARIPPVTADRHQSAALFDSVTEVVRGIAIWDYIIRLLQEYDRAREKLKQSFILQELSNTCHLEYHRSQDNLKRKVAPYCHFAGKYFKRTTNNASGQPKIVMKVQPADFTVSDPQLHYILQLCHSNTSPMAAVHWLQKLYDHHARYAGDQKA